MKEEERGFVDFNEDVDIIDDTRIQNQENLTIQPNIHLVNDLMLLANELYEYFEDEKNVYLVTEICRGGELFDKIIEEEFFSEKEAALIFKQILQSLNYCHS